MIFWMILFLLHFKRLKLWHWKGPRLGFSWGDVTPARCAERSAGTFDGSETLESGSLLVGVKFLECVRQKISSKVFRQCWDMTRHDPNPVEMGWVY